MSTESAFNKRLEPETTFDKIEGVLEHLNLSPKAIEWIRKNRKIVATLLIILVVGAVAASFYVSHREKKINAAASALSLASTQIGSEKIAALKEITKRYRSTSPALWARVEIAQESMKGKEYAKAGKLYEEIMQDTDTSSPLYPLLVYGKAEALEGARAWSDASAAYTLLQDIVGYEPLGYLGEGRILEAQGKTEKALAVYNNFLLKAADDPRLASDKLAMKAKIARMKAVREN